MLLVLMKVYTTMCYTTESRVVRLAGGRFEPWSKWPIFLIKTEYKCLEIAYIFLKLFLIMHKTIYTPRYGCEVGVQT